MLRRYIEVLLMTTGAQTAWVRLALSVSDASAIIKADGCTQDVVCWHRWQWETKRHLGAWRQVRLAPVTHLQPDLHPPPHPPSNLSLLFSFRSWVFYLYFCNRMLLSRAAVYNIDEQKTFITRAALRHANSSCATETAAILICCWSHCHLCQHDVINNKSCIWLWFSSLLSLSIHLYAEAF